LAMTDNPILIEITRGPLMESHHRGAYAVIDDEGNVVTRAGDIDRLIYPRSALKLLQALPLIESGAADHWRLSETELALACASHNGEKKHVNTVLNWLQRAGLSEGYLRCGSQPPTSREARTQLIIDNVKPGPVHHNCSGKHTGFLTTAAYLKEPLPNYLDLDHPVQRRVREALTETTSDNLDINRVGVDGCGAPIFGMPLRGLALAMARYGTGAGLSAARMKATARLYSAIVHEPFMIGGSGRWCTKVMKLTGTQLAIKEGAEGVYCGIVPAKRIGIALKIDDGGSRAAEAMMGLLLIRYAELDSEASTELEKLSLPSIFNSEGREVGTTRPMEAI
jgi:L-asparaginase II